MTGLLFFALIGLWMWACVAMTKAVTRRMRSRPWRWITAPVLLATLLVLPILDEIVGGFQFRALCENATLKIDAEKARGKTVKVVIEPSNQVLHGLALKTYHSHLSFRDAETDAEVAQYDRYSVEGGRLIRALGMSESNAPLTIGQPYCSPPERGLIDKKYGFRVIN